MLKLIVTNLQPIVKLIVFNSFPRVPRVEKVDLEGLPTTAGATGIPGVRRGPSGGAGRPSVGNRPDGNGNGRSGRATGVVPDARGPIA